MFQSLRVVYLKYLLEGWLVSYRVKGTTVDLLVKPANVWNTLYLLKNNINIKASNLLDIVVIDELLQNKKTRYRVIYSLLSIVYNVRINIHFRIPESFGKLSTTTNLFANAAWLEREAWDMFGLTFVGNTDLRRILTDYQFKGHALRKDFPVAGFYELFYYDAESRIIYTPISTAQEIKQFKIKTTWK